MSDFKHECPEWDFMEITLNDLEAVACCCFTGNPEADALYEARRKEMDEAMQEHTYLRDEAEWDRRVAQGELDAAALWDEQH